MKKLILFTLLLFFSVLPILAQSESGKEPSKFVLSEVILKDKKINHLASDISNYIFRRKNGFSWPVTKIVFSQENNKLKLDITAIDNGWNKLIETNEKPYGYSIINNRMFIISTMANDSIDLTGFFDVISDTERSFFNSTDKSSMKNPKWIYTFEADEIFPALITSDNLQLLGK